MACFKINKSIWGTNGELKTKVLELDKIHQVVLLKKNSFKRNRKAKHSGDQTKIWSTRNGIPRWGSGICLLFSVFMSAGVRSSRVGRVRVGKVQGWFSFLGIFTWVEVGGKGNRSGLFFLQTQPALCKLAQDCHFKWDYYWPKSKGTGQKWIIFENAAWCRDSLK